MNNRNTIFQPHPSGVAIDDRASAARRGYGRRWHKLRLLALARDRYTCRECGCVVDGSNPIDHVVPLEAGGEHTLANIRTLCRDCHERKHGRKK